MRGEEKRRLRGSKNKAVGVRAPTASQEVPDA